MSGIPAKSLHRNARLAVPKGTKCGSCTSTSCAPRPIGCGWWRRNTLPTGESSGYATISADPSGPARSQWPSDASAAAAVIAMYFAVAEIREPPVELWGVLIKAFQVVLLGAVVFMIIRGPQRQHVERQVEARTSLHA